MTWGTVLVVIGTDMHPFDRLMGWIERWYGSQSDRPDLLVQYGRSRRPDLPGATVVDFLDHDALRQAMARATVVVSHGGPATISEARQAGHLPLVVPRNPELGEHVDDHQQLFARRLSQDGMIILCHAERELVEGLNGGLADPASLRLSANLDQTAARTAAVAKVGTIVDELVRRRSR